MLLVLFTVKKPCGIKQDIMRRQNAKHAETQNMLGKIIKSFLLSGVHSVHKMNLLDENLNKKIENLAKRKAEQSSSKKKITDAEYLERIKNKDNTKNFYAQGFDPNDN